MTRRERLLIVMCAVLAYLALPARFEIIPRAGATGSASVPNNIGAQAGPNIAASLFDQNWSALVTYINAREPTPAALAARPAAGTSGRWYITTDTTMPVTLYFDTGAAWTTVGSTAFGVPAIRNLVGTPGDSAGANLLTQYSVTSDLVQLRNPVSGEIVLVRASSTLTNNTATAGPAANGRDRATGFSDSDRFIHLYYIYNPSTSTTATLSSTCSTTNVGGGTCSVYGGPTLPSGYTSWAYIGPLPWNGTLLNVVLRGPRVCYTIASRTLSNGAATAETAVSVASQVASNALSWSANVFETNGTPLHFRVITGREYYGPDPFAPPGGRAWTLTFPNVSQQFLYFGDANPGVYVDVTCYTVPNGAS